MPLSDYKEEKEIGRGACGQAILVTNKKDRQKYVMKKMDVSDPELRKVAETELVRLMPLHDPYIVAYKESFIDKNCICLIMEYCEGGDLAAVIKAEKTARGMFPEDQIVQWTAQLCLGLKYLHDQGVVHRDLKPQHIFMTHDKQVRIGDFGIARKLDPGSLASTAVGTPLYVSPEIVEGRPYNTKVDVWSLGCCVYEMMTLTSAIDPMKLMLQKQWVVGAMPASKYSKSLIELTDSMLTIDDVTRPTIDQLLGKDIMKRARTRLAGRSKSTTDHLDEYKFLKEIGRGSYGQALLYEHKATKTKYVVKKMDISDTEVRKTAESELVHLSLLHDTYIVAYKESYIKDNFMYLIMEYCEGGDLQAQILAQKATKQMFPEDQILSWTVQICLGLKYLHANQVLHRDLKPQNIFMTLDKRVKIGDFGISRQLNPGDLASTAIGTPLYLSPEIVQQIPYDSKVDVWSLGCCVYEMMTFTTACDPLPIILRQQWIIRPMPTSQFSSELTTLTDLMLTVDAKTRPTVDELLKTDVLKDAKARLLPGTRPKTADSRAPRPRPPVASKPSLTQPISGASNGPLLPHGFTINKEGQLREMSTGKPFEYDVCNDRVQNEQRYQALAQSITMHIHSKLENELKMTKIYLPLDAARGEARCFIYATPNYKTTAKKLLVLIQGNGAPRVGEWARKVIVNDSLKAGSQLPWVERGMKEGYAVMLLNPNLNTEEIAGKHVDVRGSETSDNHVTYVWDNVITKSSAKQIAIVAHSYGGINTIDLAINRQDKFLPLVKAIAFTDSVHSADKWPKDVLKFLREHGRNWVTSKKPLDTPIRTDKSDVPKVSAGDERHEWTTWSSFESIFTFFGTLIT